MVLNVEKVEIRLLERLHRAMERNPDRVSKPFHENYSYKNQINDVQPIIILFSDIISSNWSIISFTNHICVWSLSFWATIYMIFCAIPISKEFPSIWQESSPNNYVTHWTNYRNQNFPVSCSVLVVTSDWFLS